MLKYFLYFVLAVIIIGLIGGGIHLLRVDRKNKSEMARYQGAPIPVTADLGKTLVIYYSLSGHTKDIAMKIKEKTSADIYEIKTAETIKPSPSFYLSVKKQLKNGKYPPLSGTIPDLSQYDTIFVGAPVWWYTIATPGLSFLKETDFQNKKVVPFSTQGSNFGTFFEDFKANAKNARLQKSASFNNLPPKYGKAVDNKIAEWLNQL